MSRITNISRIYRLHGCGISSIGCVAASARHFQLLFSVCVSLAYTFVFCLCSLEIQDLTKLITAYQQRTFDEDVAYMENELGGAKLPLFINLTLL